jgi:hypothetical protein
LIQDYFVFFFAFFFFVAMIVSSLGVWWTFGRVGSSRGL